MPISSNRFKNLRGPLMVAGAACFFLGVAAYWYTDGFYFPPEPAPLPPPKTAAPKPGNAGTESKPAPPVNPVEPAKLDTPAGLSADAGTVLAYAEKQAELEVVKMEVAIAEQRAKLTELREGKSAINPVAARPVPQPVPVLPGALPPELPPLPSLPAATPGELPPLPSGLASDGAQPRRSRSGLIAVQGVDGKLSAVFATGNGKKTVRVGDALMGSKVRTISLDSVTLSSGKTLTIED